MIDVSQSFLDEIYKTSRYVQVRGTLSKDGVVTNLESDDFVSGSISRVSKAVGASNFRIGDTHIDHLDFSLGIKDNQFNNLVGSTVVVEFGLELAEDVIEWCKLGTFIINTSGVKRKTKTIGVVADSMLSKADKSFTGISTGTPYDLANWCCSGCGLELATTKEEFSAFANGNISLSIPDPNVYDGIKTHRDLLMWIANTTCTFVTCNVDGKVVFKPYSGVSVWEINPDTIANKEFGDYIVNITNVTMKIQDKEYNLDTEASEDNTLALDENPLFINYVADGLREQALTAIRDELNLVQFIPFRIEFNGNPALEVGDWVTYKGSKYLITSSTFKFKGKSTIQGVGLVQGNTKKQSSTSRGTGGSSSGGGAGVDYKTVRYVNSRQLSIGSARTRIFDFDFEVGADVTPMLTVLVTCDITKEGFVRVLLNYDNVNQIPIYQEFMPVGTNSLAFTFPLAPRSESMQHILYGYIESEDGAEGTISIEHVLASLSAWGMSTGGDEWNGRIEVIEEVPLFTIDTKDMLNMLGVSESVAFGESTPKVTLKYTATQATLSGSATLRSNSDAEDGYDIDYLGYYDDGNTATWSFDLPNDSNITLSVEAATSGTRYLAVYIDDVLVNSSMAYNSGSYQVSTLMKAVQGYSLSAGTHTVTVAKASGSYAPLVDFIEIIYTE